MSNKFSCINSENTLYIKNIDWSLEQAEIETVFSQFGKIVSIIYKEGKLNLPNYAIIEYETKEVANHALQEISGKKLGNLVLVASIFKSRLNKIFESKNEFYDMIRIKIDEVYEYAKKKTLKTVVKENKSIVFEYKQEQFSMDMPIAQALEIFYKKVVETAPDLLSKTKKHIKKLNIDALYSMISDQTSFLSFIQYLKTSN